MFCLRTKRFINDYPGAIAAIVIREANNPKTYHVQHKRVVLSYRRQINSKLKNKTVSSADSFVAIRKVKSCARDPERKGQAVLGLVHPAQIVSVKS